METKERNKQCLPSVFFCPDDSGKNTLRLTFSTASEEKIRACIPIPDDITKTYISGKM